MPGSCSFVAKNLEHFFLRKVSGNDAPQHQSIVEAMNHVAPRENPCQASLLKLEQYKTPQAANRFVIRSCDMLPITRSWFLTSWSTTSILYSYQRLYYLYNSLYIEIDISYYDVFIQQLESESGCLEPPASSCSSISLEGVLPISPYHHNITIAAIASRCHRSQMISMLGSRFQ